MTAGFRIRTRWERLDRTFVSEFSQLPVAVVSDVMSRLVSGGASLRPMHRSQRLLGLVRRCQLAIIRPDKT